MGMKPEIKNLFLEILSQELEHEEMAEFLTTAVIQSADKVKEHQNIYEAALLGCYKSASAHEINISNMVNSKGLDYAAKKLGLGLNFINVKTILVSFCLLLLPFIGFSQTYGQNSQEAMNMAIFKFSAGYKCVLYSFYQEEMAIFDIGEEHLQAMIEHLCSTALEGELKICDTLFVYYKDTVFELVNNMENYELYQDGNFITSNNTFEEILLSIQKLE